ncbi:putative ATP-binding protein involved in virulence [Paenibacillus larvae subsp. larvae]|uniref:Putative ATP-binding protein involved in virulence n=3 Tax=Paenibacillus larvae TaxID=1464 RepID=A0A2L1U4Y4_9BACL|nr:AAA family ATPase [Paenibacillus larvae]AQT84312.1 chromosome segregation protein SMC [Paenibacillus larvae subsp. pulvifaciens]AQZ46294.1 chromosome segregation protein SMC [Paenibacillus larvae subsp. pulvifaciens]AVF27974.1 putative ATP-binding protein involved in virulence [Paenibacillus larvae subsp. larvae]AVF32476.1 putative ATP-binding protein involved in virulence [Paenibacillus larvae subsp. larvae]MBH0343933.1 chromosome segregation protein SMC [Paenibacillus larvae]
MIKINKLEIENVKRVKAVKIEPTTSGLTVVGGKNNQGKTSVLDAIAWGLGGNKYRPSQAKREGSAVPPHLHIVLSNGLIVERKGKNSDLKVIDPNGQKGGQQLLDSFVEELAIDLPKFMNATNKEKANILLRIIGVGDKLHELEVKEQEVYNQRHAIGKIADQKAKYAKEQPYYPDAPKEPVSAAELIRQQQEILAKNGENQRKRQRLNYFEAEREAKGKEIARLEAELIKLKEEYMKIGEDLAIARKDALDLHDESTAELEANIRQIDEINRKVRANLDKDKAEADASEYRVQYDKLTSEITEIRQQKTDLLTNANLPLPGLSVEDGELIYNGQRWDNMSGSEQLRVATAIVRRLKPDCGFILLDKLEQMDIETLREFGKWLEQEGLQAIATRVSTGEECSILIQDGYVVGQENIQLHQPPGEIDPGPTWKVGEF